MFFNLPTVTKNILIINVLMFLLVRVVPGLDGLLACYYPGSELFRPWQVITSMFMHADFSHIALNMLGVVFLGPAIEQYFGSKRFLFYYLFTGVGALLLHFFVTYIELRPFYEALSADQIAQVQEWARSGVEKVQVTDNRMIGFYRHINVPIVGASGALFGILVAFGMKFPNTRLMLLFPPIPIKAKYFVIGYGLIELFLGFRQIEGDSVAHFAHLGGLLFGFLLIKYWERNSNQYRRN